MTETISIFIMPIRKSADDIRRQSDRIYTAAVQRLHDGALKGKEFKDIVTKVFDTEARYVSNIRKQRLYRIESSLSERTADATLYDRTIYMGSTPSQRAAL